VWLALPRLALISWSSAFASHMVRRLYLRCHHKNSARQHFLLGDASVFQQMHL
jgi:hypothetical protein